MPSVRQRAWIPWAIVALLFFLCGFLAFFQNRWLDEVSRADRQRFHQDLQDELELIRHEFDGEIHGAIASVTPSVDQILGIGAEKAAALRFQKLNDSGGNYFRSVAVVQTGGDGPQFDPDAERRNPALIDLPIPGSPDRMLIELNLDYLRRVTFPALLVRYLDSKTKVPYQAEVLSGTERNNVIFQTNPVKGLTRGTPDGSVGLLDAGKWRLIVRYEQGSLDAVVARAAWRNAGMSAGLLALILVTGALLASSSRRAQQLAELQFNFVTGVSHELRTPITVIRTAAYNLRGKLATQPAQVERYGQIIQEEGEKLSALVEQVLAFASARSGRVIQTREPLAVDRLIDQVEQRPEGFRRAAGKAD